MTFIFHILKVSRRGPYWSEAKSNLVCDVALSKLPEDQRRNVKLILDNVKTAVPLKRTLLTKLGLTRATLDDIEALLPTGMSYATHSFCVLTDILR